MILVKPGPARRDFQRIWRHLAATAAFALLSSPVFAQKAASPEPPARPLGVKIVSSGGEPELRVDGVPFFVHAAQFDYFRIPPDLWYRSLDRYRELDINTIDLRIPWNWHEPSEAKFDFDGHTNRRRDLRGLVRQITRMGFKLIVRPGPIIGDHWRNAGYPSWLLAQSEYKMSVADIQKGIPPPLAQLAARDANAAARGWLANPVHMTYARRWLTAVGRALAPYSAKNLISITEPAGREGKTQQKLVSGPLLFVALDDVEGIQPGEDTSDLARYLAVLRGALAAGGLDAPVFLNVTDAGMQGLAPMAGDSSAGSAPQIPLAGHWFFNPPMQTLAARPVSTGATPFSQMPLLKTADASSLSFLAHSLGTQANFPPFLAGFATTTFAPAGDIRAAQSSPENVFLAARLLIGSGIRGLVYSPLQDTLTPPGWETQSAAPYFNWDAPLDLAGNKGVRARGVSRNGEFISEWGAMLAASHVRADFGIVDLRQSAEKTDAALNSRDTGEMEQLFRVASLAGYAPELVNPSSQSAERLLRDRVIVLPMLPGKGSEFRLSEKAQASLVEFVRQGGTLVYFPPRPPGALLEPLWQDAGANALAGQKFNGWTFQRGRVIAASSDYSSWMPPGENFDKARTPPDNAKAVESLDTLLKSAGVRQGLRRIGAGEPDTGLIAGQVVSNASSAAPDHAQKCIEGQLCAAALISVTNLNPRQAANESFEWIDPRPAATARAESKIAFDVSVPARESLLLPIHAPLCSAVQPGERCSDEVIVAGAELLGAERSGKTLELAFYAPSNAVVRLHLQRAPSRVELDENIRLEGDWNQETGELEVHILRGTVPDFRRVLRIRLRYTPHVKAKPRRPKNNRRGSEYEVFNAIRFPLGTGATIPTHPPLIAADADSGGYMVMSSQNHTNNLRFSHFTLDGAFHGSGSVRLYGVDTEFTRIRIKPAHDQAPAADAAPSDGLLRATLTVRSGHEHATTPVLFLVNSDAANAHYQFDFDRDGAKEWVLENSRLRVIVSPAEGGRALALVDKTTNDDLITLGGALHDFLVPRGTPPQDAYRSGDFSFNRVYHAEWVGKKPDAGLQLTYRENEDSSTGIHVKKTLRWAAPETVEAAYRISFIAPPATGPAKRGESERSFISMLSVPVSAPEEGNTLFCWNAPAAAAPAQEPSTAKAAPEEPHCENFVSSGAPISIPDGIARLEILHPGRKPLAVEWTSGRAVIVPRAFSAQVNFTIPVPAPSEAPGEFTLRYTIGSSR